METQEERERERERKLSAGDQIEKKIHKRHAPKNQIAEVFAAAAAAAGSLTEQVSLFLRFDQQNGLVKSIFRSKTTVERESRSKDLLK